jgi:hypothetical protein
MRVLCRSFRSILPFSIALIGGAAYAEVPGMEPAKLEAFATHIFSGKLSRIYTSVEKSAEWETTHSVAEVQISKVEKGEHSGKLAYVRFWHRRFIGKGEAPDGAYGHRDIPAVSSVVRVFVRQGEDGGYDLALPNGILLISAPAQEKKKTSEPG